MRTPRDAFGKLAPLSNMPCSHAVSQASSSTYSQVKMHGSKNGESNSEANSDESFESELSPIERILHAALVGPSYAHGIKDESANISDVKSMHKSCQEIRSNLDSSIGNCSTSGKQSSKEELNRCYKNMHTHPSHKISKAFLPHWVYRMYDSYWLAQRAAGSFAFLLLTLLVFLAFSPFIVMISLLWAE